MDWNNPSKAQIEVLVTGMKECFPDIVSLDSYLSIVGIKSKLPQPILRNYSMEEYIRFYVGWAIKRELVGELYEKLMEMPQFAKSLADQQARNVESMKRFFKSLPKRETQPAGWLTEPEPHVLAVAEPDWDDLSGKQLKVIRAAIEKAFPNPRDFDIFLSDINQRPLSSHSAAGGFPHQLHDFLKDVQAEGWARELVEGLEATKRLPLKNLTSDLGKATR